MPSTLRQRAQQRRRQAELSGGGHSLQSGFVADPTYNEPTTVGIILSTGRTMSLIKRGDQPGHSPSWLGNNEFGKATTASADDVINTGMLCGPIPPTAEQLGEVYGNLQFRDELPAK